MRLSDILTEERVTVSLRADEKSAVLDALAGLLARGADGLSVEAIAKVLKDREQLASTGVGDEVAIPHGRVPGLQRVVAAVALCVDGLPFDAIDGRPVKILVAILAPDRAPGDQLRALAKVSRLLRDRRVRERILATRSAAELLGVFQDEELSQP
ncbi:MAG: PTS sugar transporter subunit IIA [Polyangiales bacterium]